MGVDVKWEPARDGRSDRWVIQHPAWGILSKRWRGTRVEVMYRSKANAQRAADKLNAGDKDHENR